MNTVRRIVILHGRAAQWDIRPTMEREWEDALRFGLERIGWQDSPDSIDVRLAFYGDIWRPDLRQPLPEIKPAKPGEELGVPGVSDVSLWIDEHLGVGDTLLELLLRDVDDYFRIPDLRSLTNARLTRELADLKAGQHAIVIGFSMGSLVAYDTLRANPKLPVSTLLTIGSPLAMPSFYRRVQEAGQTPYPGQLLLWANLWTKDDPATAGHADMELRYRATAPSTRKVLDVETWGRSWSPTNPAIAHNALDYMSSRVFATALVAALGTTGGN